MSPALLLRPPIVARKAVVPAPMPIGSRESRITIGIPHRALARGLGAAVRRVTGAGGEIEVSRLAFVCVLGVALGVRQSSGGLLLEGCGFGELELLLDDFDGLFGEFLLDAARAFGAGAGGVALWHGG